MVWCGGLVQIDMGLNQNHRLCGLLMVWEIPKNGFDSRLSVQNVGGLPLRHEEEHGGSILFLCMKLVGMMFGPQF